MHAYVAVTANFHDRSSGLCQRDAREVREKHALELKCGARSRLPTRLRKSGYPLLQDRAVTMPEYLSVRSVGNFGHFLRGCVARCLSKQFHRRDLMIRHARREPASEASQRSEPLPAAPFALWAVTSVGRRAKSC